MIEDEIETVNRQKSMIARVWEGDYKLPVQYWVFWWMPLVVLKLALIPYDHLPESAFDNPAIEFTGLGLIALWIAVVVVSGVGVCRSAERRHDAWGVLAMVSVGFTVLMTVLVLVRFFGEFYQALGATGN
jgi:hypothetical protein